MKITFTDDTGVETTFVPETTVPVVTPTDTEVDIILSDGTTKKFVPMV